jgi:hydrogenase maturation protease
MTRTLIFGLGSAHGDDQLGWLVAERLAAEVSHPGFAVRRGTSPCELLDLLDGLDRLIVCDACEPLGAPGTIHRWRWPDLPIARFHSSGSHDMSLVDALRLAEQLRVLPPIVTVAAAEMESAGSMAPLSTAMQVAVDRLVAGITEYLYR